MEYLNFTCQGESHKIDNKVCQDFSLLSTSRGVTVAIVCDGHGGNRYFRSDIGAKFAAETAEECVRFFVKETNSDIFQGKPYTAVGPISELPDNYKDTAVDKLFRQLFASIIFKWNEKILDHAESSPISEWETENVEEIYLNDFHSKKNLEKVYGTTLMAFVKARKYWFAFHIGDGKCISLQQNPIWMEPIPWDDRCFLNKTTSLCDSAAISEFRYCYQGDGHFPIAIFLGSDGIDDSFGETTNMVNFYIQLAKEIVTKSRDAAMASLHETLPQLSKIGSKDDMSVACVYDYSQLKSAYANLIQWQIDNVNALITEINTRILKVQDGYDSLAKLGMEHDKARIEIQYAVNDLNRAFAQKQSMVKKINYLLQERDGDTFEPYSDNISYDVPKIETDNKE